MDEETKSSYLEYLPAVYQEDPFLGHFLLPFEEVLTGLGDLLADIDRYFAPTLTDPDFLPWLANWVALLLEVGWDEAKQRRLIGEAVELYRWRGTVRGLKRYLEIYTGLVPDIREWRWPGGMQIGIASQIGGTKALAPEFSPEDCQVSVSFDYYVVDTTAPHDYPPGVDPPDVRKGQPMRLYYRADKVERVQVGDGYVIMHYDPPGSTQTVERRHEPATVTRRDGLAHDCHILTLKTEGETETLEYRGNTYFVEEVERPYRFIVDVRVPVADMEKVELDKVRAIVDLEKPAHTMYYLRLTPVVSEYVLERMQIGLRSTVGLDTTVG